MPIGELLWHWRGSAHYIATYKKQFPGCGGRYPAASSSRAQPKNHPFYGAYDSADRLLSDSTNTYTYDEEGNLLTRTTKAGGLTTSCTWTAEHRLIGIKYADGTTATIKYDPLGRMVEIDESTGVARYADDQQNLAAEYAGTNTLTASFIQDPTTTNRALEMVRGDNGTSTLPTPREALWRSPLFLVPRQGHIVTQPSAPQPRLAPLTTRLRTPVNSTKERPGFSCSH